VLDNHEPGQERREQRRDDQPVEPGDKRHGGEQCDQVG
jgi:hypothetical protein